jgi:uncharacterized SAM-dependent methyltransferase
MHLVSVVKQSIEIPALDLIVRFKAGETIWTESSHKYSADTFLAMVCGIGFRAAGQWIDRENGFLEALFIV